MIPATILFFPTAVSRFGYTSAFFRSMPKFAAMTSASKSWFAALGFLRLALIALTLLNIGISAFDSLFFASDPVPDALSLWTIIALYVTPVMAPLYIVVLLFDYIMSRVRAADAEGEVSRRYRAIARIELAMIALSLLYWIPLFVRVMG